MLKPIAICSVSFRMTNYKYFILQVLASKFETLNVLRHSLKHLTMAILLQQLFTPFISMGYFNAVYLVDVLSIQIPFLYLFKVLCLCMHFHNMFKCNKILTVRLYNLLYILNHGYYATHYPWACISDGLKQFCEIILKGNKK